MKFPGSSRSVAGAEPQQPTCGGRLTIRAPPPSPVVEAHEGSIPAAAELPSLPALDDGRSDVCCARHSRETNTSSGSMQAAQAGDSSG